MSTQSRYYTGATWEYLFPDGSPGIGLFTSLAHPWGSAPTYVLTEYILGVSAVEPGYRKWSFAPTLKGLDVDWVNGTLPTPHGNIVAQWNLRGKDATLSVTGPSGTSGVIEGPWMTGNWKVNGKSMELDGSYEVHGGKQVVLEGIVW